MTATPHSAARAGAGGFSLIELLAGLTLSLMMVATIYSFHTAQTKALAAQNAYADSQAISRTAMDLITREVRMATYDPTGTALATSPGPTCPGVLQGLVEATPTRVRFQQDLDGDGAIGGASEDVAYEQVGNELQRTSAGTVPLVTGLAAGGLALRYFDGSNPPVELVPTGSPAALTAAERDCVAKLRVTIRASVANPNPANPNPLTSTAQSEVAIRNRSLTNF